MTFYQIICLIIFASSNNFTTGAIAQNQPPTEDFTISRKLIITSVSDGDSLRSGKLRIRLFGIDAPEKNQQCTNASGAKWACGETAQKALEALVADAPYLHCDLIDTDRYGRAVMKCLAGETDLGAALVRAGLALAYRQYSSTYRADEDSAKTAKLGMWSGAFTAPWAWRQLQ